MQPPPEHPSGSSRALPPPGCWVASPNCSPVDSSPAGWTLSPDGVHRGCAPRRSCRCSTRCHSGLSQTRLLDSGWSPGATHPILTSYPAYPSPSPHARAQCHPSNPGLTNPGIWTPPPHPGSAPVGHLGARGRQRASSHRYAGLLCVCAPASGPSGTSGGLTAFTEATSLHVPGNLLPTWLLLTSSPLCHQP